MVNSNNCINVKLVMLGKTQEDLRQALMDKGYEVSFQSLSRWILGQRQPSDPDIMAAIGLILAKWEKGAGNNGTTS